MIDDLMSFWTSELGSWRLILRHMKPALGVALGLFICSVLVILKLQAFPYWNFLVSFVPALLAIFILNISSRRALKKVYGIKVRSAFDNPRVVKKLRKDLFDKELSRRGLLSKNHLKELSGIVYQEASDAKFSGFLNLGFISAALIPLWSQVLSWVFTHEIKNWAACERVALQTLGIIILLWTCWFQLRNVAGAIIDMRYFQLKSMGRMLEELAFESDQLP